MKRIISTVMATAFVLAFGTAYAATLSNGITDFSGGSYDTFAIAPDGGPVAAAEGSQDVVASSNGVTDFSGGGYDLFVIGPVPADINSVEGVSAGGLRMDPAPGNGITDYSGTALDRGEIAF